MDKNNNNYNKLIHKIINLSIDKGY
jgi:hypothetical protein